MPHYDDIYEIAADNYGLVTYRQAQEAGVSSVELRRFVVDGRLERLGYGIYKIAKYIPTFYDHYAEAVVRVGTGSYIHGESVLAMHNLALVNPQKTTVATPKRTRKALPGWIGIIVANGNDEVVSYEGIPSQSVADALRFCRGRIMKDRLLDALQKSVHEGLIDETAEISLKGELGL